MRTLRGLVFGVILLYGVSAAHAVAAPKNEIELPDQAVFRKVTENGLVILAEERAPKDLVSVDIAVRAGSATEGEYSGSGISHFVEHMVFKGTPSRRAGDIDKEIKSYGGFLNADTSQDLTHYSAVVPSRHMDKALAILKDMLMNASFEKAEFEKERQVIINEIKLDMDEPQSRLMRALNETAYLEHPYKLPVMGYEDAFRDLKREDLVNYYKRLYVPNRMTIAVTGGVNAAAAVEAVEKEFGDFRPPNYGTSAPPPRERPQPAPRYRAEEMEINLAYLGCAFHSTGVLDADLFALDVIAMLIGRGDASRLNKALLKEKRLVHSIAAWNYAPRDPGLFVITAVLDEKNLAAAEDAIAEEIEAIKRDVIKSEELEAAKRIVLADFIFSLETSEYEARALSESEALTGDHSFSRRYVKGVQSVSADDIKRAAELYLTPDNSTMIRLVPSGSGLARPPVLTTPPAQEEDVRREVLSNGLKLIVRSDKKTPVVSLAAVIGGGLLAEDRKMNGISDFTARMLLKGTSRRKEDDITGAIEKKGGTIAPFSGLCTFGLNIEVLKPDMDEALSILRDIMTAPAFPQEAIDREKALVLALIKEEGHDIFSRGIYLLRKELYGGHPYAMRQLGEPDTVAGLTRKDIADFYAARALAGNMVISVSGDVDAGAVLGRLKTLFGELRPGAVMAPEDTVAPLTQARAKTVEMRKEESLILMGFLATSARDRDRYALDVLCSILSGYSGRFFRDLRDKQSLAYTLGCVQRLALDRGYIVFYAATTYDKIEMTKREMTKQLNEIIAVPVGEAELASAKNELYTGHDIDMQTNSFFSFESALDEMYGLGYEALYKYKDGIAAVTREELKRVAAKYLDPKTRAEVVIISK